MKKALVMGLIVLFLIPSLAYAGGAGNCVQPIRKTTKFLGVGAAFGYNYVDSRMNELDSTFDGLKNMKVKRVNQIYGKGTIGLGDYVNFYGKAGGTNYDLSFVGREPQDWSYKVDLEDGIYTGAGLNALFPLFAIEPVSFGIGFDIQGNFSYNKVKNIVINDVTATSIGGSFYAVDGQNSLYLTMKYTIDSIKTSIVPYVGGYHSWLLVGTADHLTYFTQNTKYIKKDYKPGYDLLSFGPMVGVDVDILDFFNLNVEGRFIGETAITTGATVKF